MNGWKTIVSFPFGVLAYFSVVLAVTVVSGSVVGQKDFPPKYPCKEQKKAGNDLPPPGSFRNDFSNLSCSPLILGGSERLVFPG